MPRIGMAGHHFITPLKMVHSMQYFRLYLIQIINSSKIYSGNQETVITLLQIGAMRDAKTSDGKSPADIADSKSKTMIYGGFCS